MARLSRQCERQVAVRLRTHWNAVTIPEAVICPAPAAPGSCYCADHAEPVRVRLL